VLSLLLMFKFVLLLLQRFFNPTKFISLISFVF